MCPKVGASALNDDDDGDDDVPGNAVLIHLDHLPVHSLPGEAP